MKQFSIVVLGQHIGSIWANRMADEGVAGIWFYAGESISGAVAVLTLRPGIEIRESPSYVSEPPVIQNEASK